MATGCYTLSLGLQGATQLPTLHVTTVSYPLCMGQHTFVWELPTLCGATGSITPFVWELYTLLHGAKGATIFRMGLFVELSNSLTPSLMMKTTAMYNVESRTKLTHNCPPTELSLRLSLVRTQLRAHVAQDVTKI